jgi:hypothetical protein
MIHSALAGTTPAFHRAVRALDRWLLGRDATAPVLRVLLVWGSFVLYWLTLVVATGFPRVPLPTWLVGLGYPLDLLAELGLMFFAPQVLVYLLPVAAALWLGYRLGVHYLVDLFELEEFSIAKKYLGPAMFGWDPFTYPALDIATGEIETLDQSNPLVRIGGPGYLRIHLGYAAVVESLDGRPLVCGPSQAQFIHGFDRLRDVVDLRDQTRSVESVRAMTRDGVEVHATDAQMVFRVHRGSSRTRTLEDPYPFSEASIRRLVYGQAVTETGRSRWADSLPGRVRTQIQRFVEHLTIEEFLALRPQPPSSAAGTSFHIPRAQLTALFHAPDVVERLRQEGLELDWVGVGTWELRDRPGRDPDEPGLSETVIGGWREKERVDLYGSPDYLDRQRRRGFREAAAEVLRRVIQAWRHDGAGQDVQARCWRVLQEFQQRLAAMRDELRSDPQADLPADLDEALAHLESLVEVRWFGGEA